MTISARDIDHLSVSHTDFEATATKLEQLGFTVTNRASPMLKVGKEENRNKKQRAQGKAKKSAAKDPLEPFSRAVEKPVETLQTARHERATSLP